MKLSIIYIAALVSALPVTAIYAADAFTENNVISTAEARSQVSVKQSAASNFFEASWKINGNRQIPVQVDMVSEIAANYLDNNWALPRDNSNGYHGR